MPFLWKLMSQQNACCSLAGQAFCHIHSAQQSGVEAESAVLLDHRFVDAGKKIAAQSRHCDALLLIQLAVAREGVLLFAIVSAFLGCV